jgi:hypothetical protein
MTEEEIKELINRRRLQIVVHSCIYYRFDNNLLSDFQYDKWAKELQGLQKQYPDIASECVYAKEFIDFTETGSGYNLPINDPHVVAKARQLLEYVNGKGVIQ